MSTAATPDLSVRPSPLGVETVMNVHKLGMRLRVEPYLIWLLRHERMCVCTEHFQLFDLPRLVISSVYAVLLNCVVSASWLLLILNKCSGHSGSVAISAQLTALF